MQTRHNFVMFKVVPLSFRRQSTLRKGVLGRSIHTMTKRRRSVNSEFQNEAEEIFYWNEALEIGKGTKTFFPRGIEKMVIKENSRLSMEVFDLSKFKRLKEIHICPKGLISVDDVQIDGLTQLESIVIEKNNLTDVLDI